MDTGTNTGVDFHIINRDAGGRVDSYRKATLILLYCCIRDGIDLILPELLFSATFPDGELHCSALIAKETCLLHPVMSDLPVLDHLCRNSCNTRSKIRNTGNHRIERTVFVDRSDDRPGMDLQIRKTAEFINNGRFNSQPFTGPEERRCAF